MRIALLIKSQHMFNKIKKIFPSPDFEISRNISTKQDLQEFVLGDYADIAIVDYMITWHDLAIRTFKEYGIESVLFKGDFEQLEEYVRSRFIQDNPQQDDQKESVEIEIEYKPVPNTETNQPPIPDTLGPISVLDVIGPVTKNNPDTKPADVEDMKPAEDEEKKKLEHEIEVLRKKIKDLQQSQDSRLLELQKQYQEEIERLKNQPKPEPERIEIEVKTPEKYRAIPQQFIVVGGLYRGVGASFITMALAKVLNALQIQTLVMEFPKNEPYLYYRLGGPQKLPRNYAFYYPQMLDQQKSPIGYREEWVEENITWLPGDPSTGALDQWNNDHMRKAVYRAKQTITLLDIGTSWLDPAIEDVLAQAHHILLVAGPDPSKLATRSAKNIVAKLKDEHLQVHVVANFVPDPVLPKTRDWFESLSYPVLCRFPVLDTNALIEAMWECQTIFDLNEEALMKAYHCFFPFIKQIVPDNFMLDIKGQSKGFLSRLFSRKK